MSLCCLRHSAICLVTVAGALLLLLAPSPVSAQQAPQRMDQPTITRPDPAVEQTMLRAGRSPQDLGEAISALTRMGEFKRVNELLESIEQRGYNEQQKIRIAEGIPPTERLRIIDHPEVSAAATQRLDGLFELLGKKLTSPERLGQAIESLTSDDADQTLPAMRTLFAGGEASTAALVNAIVRSEDASKRDVYLRAMLRIDAEAGTDALRRIALYGTPSVRAGALIALIRLSPRDLAENNDSLTAIITALYRGGENEENASSDDASQIAKQTILARGDRLPSRRAVVSVLRRQLHESNRVANESLRELGRTATWAMNPKRDGVQPLRLPGWVLAYRAAADAAARLIAVGDDSADSLTAQLNAMLAYNVTSDPDWGDAKQLDTFRLSELRPALAFLPDVSEADFIREGLSTASQAENAPAMVGWLRLIEPSGDVAPIAWLRGVGRAVSPLVVAIDHPNAKVRYEAAAAIARLNPQHPYAGSDRVRDRWQQMSELENRATAIVLENRPEVVAELETLINQTGFEPQMVTSVSDLEVSASLGEDLRLILCKREPMDASALEMIDVVRRIRVARDVPIVIYTAPSPRRSSREEDEADHVSEESTAESPDTTDEASIQPDRDGVTADLDLMTSVAHHDLLYGDLDADNSARPDLDLQWIGASRWQDESIRAGLIREMVRPRSVAGLYEILLQSRRRQHLPPLTPVDRRRFRELARKALR